MNISWDAKKYTSQFDFVPQYGEAVLDLIDAPEDSLVVDLGCGNGALTQKLNERGYRVVGVDASEAMLRAAKEAYPALPFVRSDICTFDLRQQADVFFSNAVFHWIDTQRQDELIQNIARQLKPGGQLVFEFGGHGCAQRVHSALSQAFEKRGLSYFHPFYFPTIGEYAPLLEKHGLLVTFGSLFDRPTPQQGEDGMASWIDMFVKKPFEGISDTQKREIIGEAEEMLRADLYRDGTWYVDYVRIRMKARKE